MVVIVTLLTSILAQICIMIQEGSPLSPNPTVTQDNELYQSICCHMKSYKVQVQCHVIN